MKMIDQKGRIGGRISVIDVIAFIALIFIALGAFSAWRHFQEAKALSLKKMELEKQNRIKSIQSQIGYYLISSIPKEKALDLSAGKLLEQMEILEIIKVGPELSFSSKLPNENIRIYHNDSSAYHALVKAKIDFFVYAKDSIFFQEKRVYPDKSFSFIYKENSLSIRKVQYSTQRYESTQIFCIRNISPKLAEKIFQKGTVLKNSLGMPLAKINRVIRKTEVNKETEVSSQTYHLRSPNFDYTVSFDFYLDEIDNKYYHHFSPFRNRITGYIEDSNNWIFVDFRLNNFTQSPPPPHFLEVPLIIHGLTKEESRQLKKGTNIIGKQGDIIGELTYVPKNDLHDFYYSYVYIRKNNLTVIPAVDLFKKKCTAKIKTTSQNFNFQIEGQRFYSYQPLSLPLSFNFNSVFKQKEAEIITIEKELLKPIQCVIELFENTSIPKGALLLNPYDGTTRIGKIIGPSEQGGYKAEIFLNKSKEYYTFNNQVISFQYEYPFLVYSKNKTFFSYGRFLPETKIRFELELSSPSEIDTLIFNQENRKTPNQFKIVSQTTTSIDSVVNLSLTIDGYVFNIQDDLYFDRTSNVPWSMNNENIVINCRGMNLNGKIIRLKRIK